MPPLVAPPRRLAAAAHHAAPGGAFAPPTATWARPTYSRRCRRSLRGRWRGAAALCAPALVRVRQPRSRALHPPALRRRRGLALFEQELAQADEDVSVVRGALYIALHHAPDVDVDAYLARLEDWGRELREHHLPPPDQRYTRRMLLAINAFMFDVLGFKGAPNAEWGAVDNSCLNHVLDQRTGIPLTLSMVYLELARAAGLPCVGVNLPAHFVVRPVAEGVEALVDVYNAGAIIAVEDAEALLSPLYGQGAKIVIDRSFFNDDQPKPRAMLTRMLTNLKQIYFNSKQYDSALLMIEYQALCAPDASIAAMNQRDRGICLYLSGRYVDAIAELQGYLDVYAAAVDRQAIEGACLRDVRVRRSVADSRELRCSRHRDLPRRARGAKA